MNTIHFSTRNTNIDIMGILPITKKGYYKATQLQSVHVYKCYLRIIAKNYIYNNYHSQNND